jgi:hypothetical protein
VYLHPGVYRLSYGEFITEINIVAGEDLFECINGNSMAITELSASEALFKLKDYRYIAPLNSKFK